MKKMRLFEIGFKDKPHSAGYSHKFYVAARDGEEAIEKGRKWLIEDHLNWWKTDGRMMEMVEILNDEVENWEDTTDAWVEKRFAESPPLAAALTKAEQNFLLEIEAVLLARLYDAGTLVI